MDKAYAFKVGDTVRCISTSEKLYDKIGKVLYVTTDNLAVDFDDYYLGHDFDGAFDCRLNHGWWVNIKDVEKVTRYNKLVIYKQGKTVIAKLLKDKQVIASAKAICSPNDPFDLLVGAQVALQRLVDKRGSKHVINLNSFHDSIEIIK